MDSLLDSLSMCVSFSLLFSFRSKHWWMRAYSHLNTHRTHIFPHRRCGYCCCCCCRCCCCFLVTWINYECKVPQPVDIVALHCSWCSLSHSGLFATITMVRVNGRFNRFVEIAQWLCCCRWDAMVSMLYDDAMAMI